MRRPPAHRSSFTTPAPAAIAAKGRIQTANWSESSVLQTSNAVITAVSAKPSGRFGRR